MFEGLKAIYFSKCHIWCSVFFCSYMTIIFCDFYFYVKDTWETCKYKWPLKLLNQEDMELRINKPIQLLIVLWMTTKWHLKISVKGISFILLYRIIALFDACVYSRETAFWELIENEGAPILYILQLTSVRLYTRVEAHAHLEAHVPKSTTIWYVFLTVCSDIISTILS